MSKIIMTSSEWVKRMEVIADYPKSTYKNTYPYNCLLWDGDRWYGDCVNIQKSLFNGRDVYNPGVNTYQSNLTNTGDCTEWGLLEQCSNISQDFTKLKSGEPRILYKPGHIGAYLGKEKTVNGRVVNVVECTPAWEDGIQYSYVDSQGVRRYKKGGESYGSWTHHGKPSKWVNYTDKESDNVEKPFTDVETDSNMGKGVAWLKKMGAVVGYSDGTYRPNNNLTRGEIAIILWKLYGKPDWK